MNPISQGISDIRPVGPSILESYALHILCGQPPIEHPLENSSFPSRDNTEEFSELGYSMDQFMHARDTARINLTLLTDGVGEIGKDDLSFLIENLGLPKSAQQDWVRTELAFRMVLDKITDADPLRVYDPLIENLDVSALPLRQTFPSRLLTLLVNPALNASLFCFYGAKSDNWLSISLMYLHGFVCAISSAQVCKSIPWSFTTNFFARRKENLLMQSPAFAQMNGLVKSKDRNLKVTYGRHPNEINVSVEQT